MFTIIKIFKIILLSLLLIGIGGMLLISICEEISYRKLVKEANEKERQRKKALLEAEQKQSEENEDKKQRREF